MNITKLFTLIICLFCFVNSFSQNYAGITSIGSVTACPNTVINIPLYIIHCPLIGSITLTINYNPAVLSAIQNGNNPMSLININSNLSTFDGVQSNNPFNGAKQVRFGWYSGTYAIYPDTNLSGVAKICDMQFRYFGGTTLVTFDNSTNNGHYSMYSGPNGPLIDTPTVNYYISGMVTQDSVPIIQGNISGNLFPCQGSTAQYSVVSSQGVSYSWSAPSTLSGTSTTDSITFFVGTFNTDTIFVSPINACGDTGTAVSLIVTENNVPVLTGPMAFSDTVPCLSTYQTYSVLNIPGVTYTWSAPSTWVGASSSNSITFLVGVFSSDTIFVIPSNVCGSGNAVSLIVTENNVPVLTGPMVFSDTVPCLSTYQTYSVMNIPGITYTWSAPSTWSGSSTSSSVTFLVGAFTTDTIFVIPNNVCGAGNAVSLIVNENTIPALSGTIAFTDTSPCVSTYQTYSVMNISGVTYTWSGPSTWIGTSTTNSITYQIGAFAYDTVFVSATNSCGTSNTLFILVHDCALGISGNSDVSNFAIGNYPNPFTDKTVIEFVLPEPGKVNIDIFNIFGEHLLNVAYNNFIQGKHEIIVNMSNFADGIYTCRVKYFLKGKVLSKTCLMNIVR